MIPAIHRLPMSAYLADPCPQPSLTASLAHTLLTKSPLHAKWEHPKLSPHFTPREETKFDIGTAAHSLILEGDDKVCVVDADDWRKKDAQAQRDEARSNGLTPLLRKHYEAVKRMVDVAREFIATCEIAEHLKDAEPEMTILWKEGETWLRARPDLWSVNRRILVNYKTCEIAAPDTFIRRMPSLGYDLNAAFYERGAHAVTRVTAQQFFIAQEITPPYSCSLIGLDPSMQEIARTKVNAAIAKWAQCLRTNTWPAYALNAHYAIPSTWEMDRHEERLILEGEVA